MSRIRLLALVLLLLAPITVWGAMSDLQNVIPTMTSNTTPSGVVSASWYSAGYEPYKVFNGSNATESDAWVSSPANPNKLMYDYGASSSGIVSLYCITSRNNSSVNPPKAWTLEGSNDNVTFKSLDSESGQFSARLGNVRVCYSVATPASYRYYRFTFTDFFYFYSVDIGEIEMYYSYPYYYYDFRFLQSIVYVALDVFPFVLIVAPILGFFLFVLSIFYGMRSFLSKK